MPLRVYCPTGHVLMVPDERAGRAVRCPKCQQIVPVPEATSRPVTEPPPRASAAPASSPAVPSPIVAAMPPVPPPPAPKPAPVPPAPAANPPAKSVAPPPPPPLNSPAKKPSPSPAATVLPPVPIPNPVPPPPPVPPPASKPSPHGLIATPEQMVSAYTLAGLIAGVALFSLAPAVWEIIDYLSAPDDLGIQRWAFLILMLGGVQIGYAVYVAQLPDWTTAWMASLFALLLAGGYGMLLGVAVMSKEESSLIQSLELTDKLIDHKAAFWSIAMISTTSLIAWYAGHLSAGWHRKELILRSAGLPAGRV